LQGTQVNEHKQGLSQRGAKKEKKIHTTSEGSKDHTFWDDMYPFMKEGGGPASGDIHRGEARIKKTSITNKRNKTELICGSWRKLTLLQSISKKRGEHSGFNADPTCRRIRGLMAANLRGREKTTKKGRGQRGLMTSIW